MRTIDFIFFVVAGLILLNLGTPANAQRYVLSESKVHFFSDAPLEDIEATTKDCKGVIDTRSNTFSFRVPIKSFVFPSSLMQQHFNENYMESEKYPNATFKGHLKGNYDLSKNGVYNVIASGDLTIHGKTQAREIPSQIIVKDGTVKIKSSFDVALEAHDIEVPSVVFQKIAEIVKVDIEATLNLYE